tara:strand:- start:587 stop:754 length:168 start_codon:yes stop_codon:yes gene_type:complete
MLEPIGVEPCPWELALMKFMLGWLGGRLGGWRTSLWFREGDAEEEEEEDGGCGCG